MRRILLALGLLCIAGAGAFPPWVTAPENHPSATTPFGYHFIINPPSMGPTGPIVWSSEHQRFEQDGQPVKSPSTDPFLSTLEREYGADSRTSQTRFVRVDYARLGVEWLVIVGVFGGLALLLPGRRPRETKEGR